jgi:hypothetical protein
MVTGSLFLLWRGRIYLDQAGEKVSEVVLPMGIKISTQFPVLIMFFLGVVLLIYPPYHRGKLYHDANLCADLQLHRKQFPEMVAITSKVSAPKPIDVYAVVGWQDKVQNNILLELPFKKDGLYRLIYSYSDGTGPLAFSDVFQLTESKPINLREIVLVGPPPEPATDTIARVQPDKDKELKFK